MASLAGEVTVVSGVAVLAVALSAEESVAFAETVAASVGSSDTFDSTREPAIAVGRSAGTVSDSDFVADVAGDDVVGTCVAPEASAAFSSTPTADFEDEKSRF